MRFTAFCFVFPPFEEENIVFRFPESASRSQLGQESNVLGSISSQLPVLAAASDRAVLLPQSFSSIQYSKHILNLGCARGKSRERIIDHPQGRVRMGVMEGPRVSYYSSDDGRV